MRLRRFIASVLQAKGCLAQSRGGSASVRCASRRVVSPGRRGGFTLIEMVFAVTIGTMVMVGAGTLLIAVQRNERAISRRAEDAAALARIRQVMQRSFSTVLMAPTPSGRASPTAVAVAATEAGTAASGSTTSSGAQTAADRNRSNKILDEARSTTPPRMLLAGASSAAFAGGTGGLSTGAAGGGAIAPVGFVSTVVMAPSPTLQIPGGLPQRLELVLIDPPVPTQQRDVFEVARVVRKVAQERLSRAELAKQRQGASNVAEAVPVDSSGESEEEDPEGMNDVRAVRGAFELRPQQLPEGRVRDEDDPQAWELWWVPERAKRTVQEMRELSKAMRVVEEAALGDPFRIASNIKTARWRMFHDAVKKDEFSAVFRQDVPAYVEMDIEMASGMTAQWLFEVGLQTGPEVQAPRSTTNAQGTGSSATNDVDSARSTGGGAGTTGAGSGAGERRSIPATPMQPSQPIKRGRDVK